MKRNNNLSSILLLLFTFACGHNVEKIEEHNFIPASQKNQPRIIYPKVAQESSYSGITKIILSISNVGTVDNVFLEESSGYEILDKAAIDYCKNLVFYPAKVDDKTVYSKLRREIKFKISQYDRSKDRYINEIKDLYISLIQSASKERNRIEREILMKYNDFVDNMNDALNFNKVSEQIILPEISEEWKEDWNNWPLSFLIYHDFLVRFPEYDSVLSVKTQLLNSLKYDIQYIKNTPDINHKVKKDKENILMKIKSFIGSHYPDIIIDNLGVEERNNTRSSACRQSYAVR